MPTRHYRDTLLAEGRLVHVKDDAVGKILVQQDDLRHRVSELARQISDDYQDREVFLVGVLKGAMFFIADLMRQLQVPVQVDFMTVSSYGAETGSSGVVRIQKDLDSSIEGLHVLIIEDIIDSGLTLNYLMRSLSARNPASLEVCALLNKTERRQVELPVQYVGFEIPNTFVIGYGLDLDQNYRQLPYIAELKDQKK